jgi:hypothetical protein
VGVQFDFLKAGSYGTTNELQVTLLAFCDRGFRSYGEFCIVIPPGATSTLEAGSLLQHRLLRHIQDFKVQIIVDPISITNT